MAKIIFLNAIKEFTGVATRRDAALLFIYVLYFVVANLIGFTAMVIDKKRAYRGKSRIAENVLFSIGVVGGSIGIIIAMRSIQHKTKKRSFTIGVPIAAVFNSLVLMVFIITCYI